MLICTWRVKSKSGSAFHTTSNERIHMDKQQYTAPSIEDLGTIEELTMASSFSFKADNRTGLPVAGS